MPETRPVLYRSYLLRTDGKIASFTGRNYCAQRFSENKGFLIICYTAETLRFYKAQKQGGYTDTFYSVSELLRKEANSPTCQLSECPINDYLREDEYLMRVNLRKMYSCKWYDR